MAIHFTSIPDSAPADARTFNRALRQLDRALQKNNFSATSAPTADDDEDLGYTIGSWWIDAASGKAYICVDAAPGAAVWHATGGGGDAMEVLAKVVLSEDAYTVNFTNIPGDYETLDLHWLVYTTNTSTILYARYNDDTGNNYSHHVRPYYDKTGYLWVNTTLNYIGTTCQTNFPPTYYASAGMLRIPGYAGTGLYKSMNSHFNQHESDTYRCRVGGGNVIWQSTSAITKITLGAISNVLLRTGSRFLLLGVAT